MTTPLTFTTRICLSKTVKSRVDCRALTPNQLQGLSLDAINNMTLIQNHQRVKVTDLFEITGTNANHLIINHQTNHIALDFIGAHMTAGNISIQGDVGHYCGLNMQGGQLTCHGNSQDFTACNMAGGVITIYGNTGNFLGGAIDGTRKGMRNGVVIIKGNAGDRVGDQMRRGLILIDGNAGDYCASRMIAGSIGVYGTIGKFAGFNMQRGTLLLNHAVTPHPSLQDCGTHTLPFLSLLYHSFSQFDTKFKEVKSQRVRRYVGDLSNLGNGEILHILN